MRNRLIHFALSILILSSAASAGVAADIPKQKLPSQEPETSPDVPRGPKVITNSAPSFTNKVGATQVRDDDPSTKESVKESPVSREVVAPVENSKFKVRTVKERKTMALALGGGGARGAAHIGVLRVLEQEKIPIDYIVGNSMGSVIGGLYSAGVDLDKLEKLGDEGDMRKEYLPGVASRVLLMPLTKATQHFRHKRLAGLVSGNRFERFLDELIPEESKDLEHLKIPFSAVATNLRDGQAYRISEGKLSTAIRASASISPLLRPVKIGDRIYTDGGIRANLPASSARDTGADVVIAVLVDEPLRVLPEKEFRTYKGIASRLGDIVLAVTDEHQLQFADVIINPDVSGIPILSDKPGDVQRAIRAGEAAARKAIPVIRRKMGLPEGAQVVESPSSAL